MRMFIFCLALLIPSIAQAHDIFSPHIHDLELTGLIAFALPGIAIICYVGACLFKKGAT